MDSIQNALVTGDRSRDYLYTNQKTAFTSILSAAMPIQNFNFSHILDYCDVINDANGINGDYRHVIIKGQRLLKEHFVIDLLFKQDEMDTKMHTRKPFSMFISEPPSSSRDLKNHSA
jgi:hypothetical protein